MRIMADKQKEPSPATGEFHRIAQYFRPLAKGAPGAFNLGDDAAVFAVPPGRELVVTLDTIVEGVHFIGDEAADMLARKAMRVNLSDLAAMGATPLGYFLSLSLPKRIDDSWIEAFCAGLASDQTEFDWHLMGGDSTSTPGPISIAVTALGTVPVGQALRRSGAQVGDAVYVSGGIGDGFLGLLAAQGQLPYGPEADAMLRRYRCPDPRIALGLALVGRAHAAMDVSDGLIGDLAHICEQSGVGAVLRAQSVPLSASAAELVADQPNLYLELLTGGDDYELLITGRAPDIEAAAADSGCRVTCIGEIVSGDRVVVHDADGEELTFTHVGFRHS
jgi:thiamine-monophosphate kinase|tara:strand:+ start:124184 stop:125182 length:999 start_codon:yes stop_codon:yes gene_type:complete